MLTTLRLINIALIDCLDLAFEKGFTVVTGETGSGKSILFDALDAVLGGVHGPDGARLVRSGVDRGYIEATFTLNPTLMTWLKANDLYTDESEICLSREWKRYQGRFISKSRLNGVSVSRKQILLLRPLLIDLTVQGETQSISSSSQQLYFLDKFGGLLLKDHLSLVKKNWEAWKKVYFSLQQARANQEQARGKYLEKIALLEELETADLDDPNEDINLQEEQDRLVYGVRLQEGLKKLNLRLNESQDEFPSVSDHINSCISELKEMSSFDGSLQSHYQNCIEIQIELNELINKLSNYSSRLESDPLRLEAIQVRLSILNRLKSRYNCTLSELLELKYKLLDQIESNNLENTINELEIKEQKARSDRDKVNNKLSSIRKQTALKLEAKLLKYLRPMGLSHVQFKVAFTNSSPAELGSDSIQYLFTANPGHPMVPISDVASGGEISRFLLALKTALLSGDFYKTMFFDEIDVGVSGNVSAAIASLLKKLSSNSQVFCITHQPVVAALADNHLSVSKLLEDGVTISRVSKLDDINDRTNELAVLAGGDRQKALIYAASLLEQEAA